MPTTPAPRISRACHSGRSSARHVLRNSLLPTIAVVATQVGYLIGGLLVIEKLFNYNGIGQRIYTAAQNKDFPMLQSGVLHRRHRLPRRDARRRHPLLACSTRASASEVPNERHDRRCGRIRARSRLVPTEARIARRETVGSSLRSKTFIVGAVDRRCAGSSGRSPAHASRRTTPWNRPTRCS